MDGPWKVYFRLNEQPLEEAIRFINEETRTKSIWYFHPNGVTAGPHIHALIWDHEQTAETLRNKIKKRFNLVNKTHYGISNKYERGTLMTEETVPTYISYMSKGQYDPIFMKDYDNEYANERKREWKPPTTVRISGDLTVITKGEVKTKRITQFTIAREAQSIYVDKWTMEWIRDNGMEVRKLAKIVIELLKANGMLAHKRLVANIIQDIQADLSPTRFLDSIENMV